MTPNPFLGVFLHGVGGFAAGSFYAPLKRVRRWAWESSWMILAVAAWLVTPWVVAWLTTPELPKVLGESSWNTLGWCVIFGLLWGIGGLTFGLTMRYLGIAFGMTVALGFCMTIGTLVPPLFEGLVGTPDDWAKFVDKFTSTSGMVIIGGIVICLVGIGLCGLAGMRKESELTDEQKKATVAEFKLGKGFLVGAFSGILSACFAFGLTTGKPIAAIAEKHGANPLLANNAVLAVVLIGGFTSNFIWCLILNAKNRTFKDYVTGPAGRQVLYYFLSALGGIIWYGQFFFYGMGTTKLGKKYDFSSWSIHMAFIIIFSNLWGIVFHEWRGTSGRTKTLVLAGLLTLIGSTLVIGYGNYLAKQGL